MSHVFIRNEHPRGYIKRITTSTARMLFYGQRYKISKAQREAHKAFKQWEKLYNRVEKEKSGLDLLCLKLDMLNPEDKTYRDTKKTDNRYVCYTVQKTKPTKTGV